MVATSNLAVLIVRSIVFVFTLGFVLAGFPQLQIGQVQAQYQEYKCTSAGGTCKYTSGGCAGGFVDDYCPTQPESIKCCMPTSSACYQQLGGRCLTAYPPARFDKCNAPSTFNSGNYCPGGDEVQCCVPPPPPPPTPPAPSNVSANCSPTGVVTVTWSPASGYSYYYARIYDETTNQQALYSGVITATSFSLNNGTPGHRYSYWVHVTVASGSPYGPESPTAHTASVVCPLPTATPTVTPTRTPTPTPTRTPTPTLTPTPIPGTKLSLTLFLHGIGKAGDSVKQGEAGGGNMSPTHPNRVVRVEVFNSQNTKVRSVEATVNFDANSGSFKGVADTGDLPAGSYLIRAKFSQSLDTQIGGIQVLAAQVNNDLPPQYFVTGDVNNDGAVSLNVLDFNTIIGCIGGNSCSAEQKIQSDLDDNGRVDVFDFNLFIREITHIQ